LDPDVSKQDTDQADAPAQSADEKKLGDSDQKGAETEEQKTTESANEAGDDSSSETTKDEDGVERYGSGQVAEKPDVSDEHKKSAEEMAQSYIEERPTTVLPGSDGTVTGTAVNDWIDDDGNPVHGDIHEDLQEAAERDRKRNEQAKSGEDDDKADEAEAKKSPKDEDAGKDG
jgi:hypothetical protein